MTPLRERIAAALGWSVQDTRCFSLLALRELLRVHHPKLAAEIDELNRTGAILIGERRST